MFTDSGQVRELIKQFLKNITSSSLPLMLLPVKFK